MESSQPENGLVIEKMTQKKAHGEIDGQACCNGNVKDGIESAGAPHSSVDSKKLEEKENSQPQLSSVRSLVNDKADNIVENGVDDSDDYDIPSNCAETNHSFTSDKNDKVVDEVANAECDKSKNVKPRDKQPVMDDKGHEKIHVSHNQDDICKITEIVDKKLKENLVDNVSNLGKNSVTEFTFVETDFVQKADKDYTNIPDMNDKSDACEISLDEKNESVEVNDHSEELLAGDTNEENLQAQDEKDVHDKPHDIPPQIFEDITEDEEDEESFENIELELDDLIDPTELSRSSGSSDKGKCDVKFLAQGSLTKPLDENDCSSQPDSEPISVNQESAAESLQNDEKTDISRSVSEYNTVKDIISLADDHLMFPTTVITKLEGQLEKKEEQSNIYTILSSTSSFKTVSNDGTEVEHIQKQKFTARKSGKPVKKLDCLSLKTINLHPIKNITMKLSDVQGALGYDFLRDSGSTKPRASENSISNTDTDSNSTLASLDVNSGKTVSGSKKKRRKNTYDFPGCKKKPKRARSDELESLGSSADSISSDGDFHEARMQKELASYTPNADSSLPSFMKKSKSSSLSSSVVPSTNTSSTSQGSAVSSKTLSTKPVSKMKSVLDMLHARSKQKAEMEEKKVSPNTVHTVCVTTNATSTTTTILVSPPPNKPIIEGVKRKGTPRKRRDDVICLSDSEDSGDKKSPVEESSRYPAQRFERQSDYNGQRRRPLYAWKKGKRKRDSTDNNVSPSSSAPTSVPHSQLTKQKTPSTVAQAPVVMVVAQHSTSPGLRSLLPRQTLVSPASPAASGKMVQPAAGNMLGALPLISTLPVGATALSLANLPPGMTAVSVNSLPTGSQPAVTFFTTVPATAVPIPISGANLVNITTPVQLLNNASPGKSIKTTSSASTSLLSTKTSNASSSQINSDSLRALLVGKPYAFSRAVSSSQLTSTPMLFQMVTASGASLIPVPAQAMTMTTSSVQGMLKPTSALPVSKSSFSLLKHHPPVVPNGISCLTPPKTPDTDSSSEVAVAATLSRPVAGQVEDSEVIPLCCCKINGASFKKLSAGVTYCQALDTVDNKVLGCYNKVTNSQLVRPGVKIPFMVVCEVHRRRLKLHQCCPGCGHFCTQGKFQQCRKEGKSSVHNFHKQCVFYRGGKYYCPHCGEETNQCEVELQLNEEKPEETKLVLPRTSKRETEKKTARMSSKNMTKSRSASEPEAKPITLPNNKVINIDALPLGPDHQTLSRLLRCIHDDRPKKYRTLPKDLYTPALEGDLEKVFYLLVDGLEVNTKYDSYDDQTPLHAAAISGNIGSIFILVQFGAEIHAQDKKLRTPIMCAAENGNLKAVQFLIKAGAKVEDRGEDGMTSLHYAAKAGYIDVVQHILETEKIDVNIQDDGGWTPIMWATELQMTEVVRYLLAQGGDPNKKDNEENTSLHWAAFSGSLTIAEMFLDKGCEIDAVNEHGNRPLHIAARQDHYDMVVLLLARGADVDTKNNKNESPVESCTNKSGQVWMALKVNQQLRSFAAWKIIRPERLVERDMTMGREKNPIACVNSEDSEPCPVDYLYVTENVETSPLNINYVITSLQSCRCKDDCSSMYCVCGRSSIKCWYDKMGRLLDEVNLLEPPLVFECNRACRCWVNCNNRVVQNGITCRLQMFKTNGRGWGVRTLMDIPKGTFVCEYIGELISDSEADRREDDSYLFDLDNKDGDTYCIDARKYGNISRFINHLCEPNLVPVKVFVEHQDLRFPRICLFSSRDINAYEELGFDYGEKFWMIKWKHFTCACKSTKCKYSSETIKKTLADYKLRYPDGNVDI